MKKDKKNYVKNAEKTIDKPFVMTDTCFPCFYLCHDRYCRATKYLCND